MKTQPARTKEPKARVMYVNVFGEISCGAYHGGGWYSSILVIPCATSAQAKRALPFWKLSEEQKVEAIAKALYYGGTWARFPSWEKNPKAHSLHHNLARAILTLITGATK